MTGDELDAINRWRADLVPLEPDGSGALRWSCEVRPRWFVHVTALPRFGVIGIASECDDGSTIEPARCTTMTNARATFLARCITVATRADEHAGLLKARAIDEVKTTTIGVNADDRLGARP